MRNKLEVRDLINAGAFSVLIVFTTFIVGFIGFFPFFMPIVPFLCSLLAGPVFMLYATKIRCFGMVWILGTVTSIVFVFSGHGAYALGGIIVAFFADLIIKKGNFQSVKYARLSYTFLSIFYAFLLFPIYFSRAAYAARLIKAGFGEKYAADMMSVLPNWSVIPVILLGCVGAYIGCTIGIKMLKKHFVKAGMI